MSASRLQHLVPASIVLGLAAIVSWLSFTQQPPEAFLFSRLISIFFISLAIWNFARAAMGIAKVGGGVSGETMKNLLPGLVVMIIFVFFAAKSLGFYLSSSIAFLSIYSLYDPVPLTSIKDWGKRVFVTAIFMGVIYCLFVLLLKVQTPRGIFF
jgi:hypothetical protein